MSPGISMNSVAMPRQGNCGWSLISNVIYCCENSAIQRNQLPIAIGENSLIAAQIYFVHEQRGHITDIRHRHKKNLGIIHLEMDTNLKPYAWENKYRSVRVYACAPCFPHHLLETRVSCHTILLCGVAYRFSNHAKIVLQWEWVRNKSEVRNTIKFFPLQFSPPDDAVSLTTWADNRFSEWEKFLLSQFANQLIALLERVWFLSFLFID